MFGYSADEAAGRFVHELIIPERFREKHLSGFKRFQATGQGPAIGETLELAAIRKDGSEFPIELSLSATRVKGEWNAVGIVRDITERKRVEGALRARERQGAAVARIGQRALGGVELPVLMDEAVALVAETLGVEYCKVLELLPSGDALLLRAGVGWRSGCVGHATVGTNTSSQAGYTLLSGGPVIVTDLGEETRFSEPKLLLEHGVVSGMSVVIQGRERPFGVLGAHTTKRRVFTRDDANFLQAVANVLADAIERKRAEETIHRMAYYDHVTSLPNRMLFLDRLTVAIAHAQRYKKKLAVMFLDLDGFKAVNDEFGHNAGDQLLRVIADRLVGCIRKEDTAARLGGDEYTLLLPGIVQRKGAARIARKILDVVRKPLTLSDKEINVTTSIGIAIYPGHGEDAETLLKNADIAMYRAKERGRDNYQFYG